MITSDQVKRANLEVYNRKNLHDYSTNPSIFNPSRQAEIHRILEELRDSTGCPDGRLLDLGCGTGNLLALAKPIFREVVGLDIAGKLLAQLRREDGGLRLTAGETGRLPFPREAFDVISLYAVLHHLFDPKVTFQEAYRCLKPGGYLYTDHDPNRGFMRFYHVYYRLRHWRQPGFGSHAEELAEYHNTQDAGLDPEALAAGLRLAGFREVAVHYRHTDNTNLGRSVGFALGILKGISRIVALKSLYTHFWIVARK